MIYGIPFKKLGLATFGGVATFGGSLLSELYGR